MAEFKMKYFLVLLSILILTACNDGESDMTNSDSTIELSLNTPILDTLDKNTIAFSQECMQNINMCWYKIKNSANNKNLPSAVMRINDRSLTLQHVTSVTIPVDEKLGSNVEHIDIALRGLPDNSTHEKNRDFIVETIKNIESAGWQRYYLAEDPRIPGSQAAKINTAGEVLGRYVSSHPWLDPDFHIDIQHWLKSSMYVWYFYNDGNYLEVTARRRDSKDRPMETGTYLVTLNFLSERMFWLSGITNETERSNWKALLPGRLESYRAARSEFEKKARAAGLDIDETYQDPPIKALE